MENRSTDKIRLCPVQTLELPKRTKILMLIWKIVNGTIFRWSPARCRGFRRSVLRLFGARVAATASIHNTARIDCPWNLEIGSLSSIGERAWVYALDRIHIGDCCCIGHDVYLLTGSHDYRDVGFRLIRKEIRIGYGCWIATRALVLPGTQMGDLAVIGAGSVVRGCLEGAHVYGGNPCRILGPREMKGVEDVGC